MSRVRIVGPSVAELAAHLRGVAAELEAGTRVVQARFDTLDWDDEQARRAGQDLAASLDLLAQLAGTMWAQAQWLAAVVARVAELAGDAGASVRMPCPRMVRLGMVRCGGARRGWARGWWPQAPGRRDGRAAACAAWRGRDGRAGRWFHTD